MGSDVHLIVVGGPRRLLGVGHDLVEELEARWSRFRPTSEVSLLNAMAGSPVRVSGPTLELVRLAVSAFRLTGGRFDPTQLGAVVRAGYDRSFERLTSAAPRGNSPLRPGAPDIAIDPSSRTVTLPAGVGFDPGGIGKGLAADLLTDELIACGADGVCANLGGDLRVRGPAPDGADWVIGIEHPLGRTSATVVALRDGAVATSTRARRVLGPAEEGRHHLIDPATGEPARTGIASASVIAAEGWQAEVLVKAVFLDGPGPGRSLGTGGAEWLLVEDSGRIRTSPGFDRFRGNEVPASPETVGSGRRSRGRRPHGRVEAGRP